MKHQSFEVFLKFLRAVPGKKGVGGEVERNLKMGEPPTQFYLFLWYSPYGYSRKNPLPS